MEEGCSPQPTLVIPCLKHAAVASMLSLQVAWGVICVSDTKILPHSLLSLCFCPASTVQTLLCWVVQPAMSSILHHNGPKAGTALPQCSSSSSQVAEPVLPGSVCSSHGLPCCWLCKSLNPNPFHTPGKIPTSCQCLWTCWVGLQAPGPGRLWERQEGLGAGLVSQLLLHPWG